MPLKVINPYDQSLVCEVAYDEEQSLSRKLDEAQRAAVQWRQTSLEDRIVLVRQGVERFLSAREEIARNVTLQMGKPIAQSRNEVNTFLDRAECMMATAPVALASEPLPPKEGFFRRIDHVPLGVVFNLAAWNYPLIIPVNVIVPALLAGNVVLLKHSGRTPLCGEAYEKAFGRLDVPNLVTALVLSHDETGRVIRDPRVAHVSFTGSVAGGHQVYQQASQRFIDVGLELGGKDPAYVAEDADLGHAIANVVDGACYNAGQSCCAVERVYVHKGVVKEFVEGARAAMLEYRMGDPTDEQTTLGPLARRSALDELEAQVQDAVGRGARLLLGGHRSPGTPGHFFPPTLLTDVPNEASVMQDESFGPILPVLSVNSDEEALQRMAESRYGLTASVWTQDLDRAERLARDLDVGTVYMNRCDALDPNLPWTGVLDSGMGSTLSKYGFFHLTRRKSIHFRVAT